MDVPGRRNGADRAVNDLDVQQSFTENDETPEDAEYTSLETIIEQEDQSQVNGAASGATSVGATAAATVETHDREDSGVTNDLAATANHRMDRDEAANAANAKVEEAISTDDFSSVDLNTDKRTIKIEPNF